MLTSTELILEGWRENDRKPEKFVLLTVYGDLRIGKSAYSFKTGVQVLNQIYGMPITAHKGHAWYELRHYIVFHPEQFFQKLKEMDEAGVERLPFLIWDDAGLWLYALDWYDPFINQFIKLLNVIGTRLCALIFTTPSPDFILRKLRKFPSAINVHITYGYHKDPWERYAKGYKQWYLPDGKSRVKTVFEDWFSARMPTPFFKWYKPVRDAYQEVANKLVQEKWEQLKSRSRILASLHEMPEFNLPKLHRPKHII
jgi:hypothetical protein